MGWTKELDALNALMEMDGVVLSFGWNSRGMGMKRGYRRERIRLICHGPGHSDTICVVDRKVREQLTLFDFSDEQESEE